MKITKSLLVYLVLCNIPICLCLSLTSSFLAQFSFTTGSLTFVSQSFDWKNFLINILVCFDTAMIIGLFVPLTLIGKWFTGLFKVKHDTYLHNIPYRLLATVAIAVVYYLGITPVATILNNVILFKNEFIPTIKSLFFNMPFMLLVGYGSSLLFDFLAYKVAHKIDSNF